MTERAGYGVKKNIKKMNWETNEFPIVCEECLGEDKYMRFLKKPLGKECSMCTRPYSVFSWRIN